MPPLSPESWRAAARAALAARENCNKTRRAMQAFHLLVKANEYQKKAIQIITNFDTSI